MTPQLTIIFEQGLSGWWVAAIPEVPGAFSQGRTREEARENVLDALTELMAARTASAEDVRISEFRGRKIAEFQVLYAKLLAAVTGQGKGSQRERKLLLELAMRSSIINRSDRITGDSAILVTQNFIRWHKRVQSRTLHEVFRAIVEHQQFRAAETKPSSPKRASKTKTGALILRNLRVIRKYSESV